MNKIAYMTCVLSLAFTMQACDDFLDSFPQDTVTNENFWKCGISSMPVLRPPHTYHR
jgi:hypothetical protein